jgi:hypothetical protein
MRGGIMKNLSCAAVAAVLLTGCADARQTSPSPLGAGLEAWFNKTVPVEQVRAYQPGTAAAVEADLMGRISTALRGRADSSYLMSGLQTPGMVAQIESAPEINTLVRQLYVNRSIEAQARRLQLSLDHAKQHGAPVTLAIDDSMAGENRVLVLRPASVPGWTLVVFHSSVTPNDVADAFRAIFEQRLRIGDFADNDWQLGIRGSGHVPSNNLQSYAHYIEQLQAAGPSTYFGHSYAKTVNVRLGHLRHFPKR